MTEPQSDYNPATGAVFYVAPGMKPKQEVAKQFGFASFVLAFLPLIWFGLVLVLAWISTTVPRWSGAEYVTVFCWYVGVVLIPILIVPGIVLAIIALIRKGRSDRIWAVLALTLSVGFTALYFLSYLSLIKA